MTKQHHSQAGGKVRFMKDLSNALYFHLRETRGVNPRGNMPREDQWLTVRLRPEIATAILAFQARQLERTPDRKPSVSEVIAAAFVIAIPTMASRVFPEATAEEVPE